MEHFYTNIHGWFDFEAVYSLVVRMAPPQAHFVEVGAFEGKSTSFMAVEIANSKKNIRFDVIDTWEGSEEHQAGGSHQSEAVMTHSLYQAFLANMTPVRDIINPIRISSLEAAQRYPNASLDFVFIDASHDYDNVKADILAWRPKIKPGGIIGGHDYHGLFPGVIQAVRETIPNFNIMGVSWLSQT
jgi:predicted O-methyltransferase YrrM